MTPTGCPSKVDFSRAISTGDPAIFEQHLQQCPRCRRMWATHLRLAMLAPSLPKQVLSSDKIDSMRDAVIKGAECSPRRPTPRSLVVGSAVAASIFALLIGSLLWRFSNDPKPRSTTARSEKIDVLYLGSVQAAAGTEYRRTSTQPDEVVHVSNGTISVNVEKLDIGQRFRVLTGDAELEVVGTLFEVTASADKLKRVQVVEGVVEVRPRGRAVVVLGRGERWDAVEKAHPIFPKRLEKNARDRSVDVVSATAETVNREGNALKNRDRAPNPSVPPKQPLLHNIDSERLFNEGWLRFRRGAFIEAAALFETVLKNDRDSTFAEDAAYWCAVAYLKADERFRAETAMGRYLSFFPSGEHALDIAARQKRLSSDAGAIDDVEK